MSDMKDAQPWIDWAMCNLAAGIPEEHLVEVMCGAAIPLQAAWRILGAASASTGMNAVRIVTQKYAKACSVLNNLAALQAHNPKNLVIDKVSVPSKQEFLEDYWSAGKPVVLKNFGTDWKASTTWSMEFLANTYGAVAIEVQTGRGKDKDFELNSIAHKTKLPLATYIAMVKSVDSSNDFYMTANNQVLNKTACSKLLLDIGAVPEFLNPPSTNGMWHMWVGPKGTITPLHHDESGLIHIQITGRKRWKLISPLQLPNVYNHRAVFSKVDLENIDYAQFPLLQNVNILEVDVEPGEAIFVPLGWWHGVTALDESISIHTIDFTFPNTWDFKNPSMVVL